MQKMSWKRQQDSDNSISYYKSHVIEIQLLRPYCLYEADCVACRWHTFPWILAPLLAETLVPTARAMHSNSCTSFKWTTSFIQLKKMSECVCQGLHRNSFLRRFNSSFFCISLLNFVTLIAYLKTVLVYESENIFVQGLECFLNETVTCSFTKIIQNRTFQRVLCWA